MSFAAVDWCVSLQVSACFSRGFKGFPKRIMIPLKSEIFVFTWHEIEHFWDFVKRIIYILSSSMRLSLMSCLILTHCYPVITDYLITEAGIDTTTTIPVRHNQRKQVSSPCHLASSAVPWQTQQLAQLLWQCLG